MGRTVVRICLVVATLGTEVLLLLLAGLSGLAAADSGHEELYWVGRGIFVQMLVLFVGGLAAIAGNPASRRAATVSGVVLLVLGLVLIVVSATGFANDVNRGAWVAILVLPSAIVLGGVRLMSLTADPEEQPIPQPRRSLRWFARVYFPPVALVVAGYFIGRGDLDPIPVLATAFVAVAYILVASRR